MTSTTQQGRKASGSIVRVSRVSVGFHGKSQMATINHGRTSGVAAQAAALCQPSISLRPSLAQLGRESASYLPTNFDRFGNEPAYLWDQQGSTSIRGDCPQVAGDT